MAAQQRQLSKMASREAQRHGGNSSAPSTHEAQNRSTVFDVDPRCTAGRIGGHDDADIVTKPFNVSSAKATSTEPPRPWIGTLKQAAPAAAAGLQSIPAPASPSRQVSTASLLPSDESEFDLESSLEKLRAALRSRGAVGLHGLARNFAICDTDGDRQLDRSELSKCFKLCRIPIADGEIDELMSACDLDGSGCVDYDEFLKLVRGRLPPLRRKLIVRVFTAIDERARSGGGGLNDGRLTIEDIRDVYNAKKHPEVLAGKKSESAVLNEMLANFEGKRGNRDGTVTLEEWTSYYEELSASIGEMPHAHVRACLSPLCVRMLTAHMHLSRAVSQRMMNISI